MEVAEKELKSSSENQKLLEHFDKAKIAKLLNQQLADTIVLHNQLKNGHWNVKGNNFYALHQLFDDLSNKVLNYIDMVAERIAALGFVAEGDLYKVVQKSTLKPLSDKLVHQTGFIKELSHNYGLLAKSSRKAMVLADYKDDIASSDLMTEILRGLDKELWLLESHLH